MEKPLLPVVQEGIGFAVRAELLQKEGNEYIGRMLERLMKENSCIANFIGFFSATTNDQIGAAYCGLLVYRMLESQAEADRMKEAVRL